MNANRTKLRFLFPVVFLSALICVHLRPDLSVAAQESGEVVANLSTGRVVICVTKEGILIGAVETKSQEVESRPPAFVQLSGRRVAILLGAAEWATPGGGPPVQLERELMKSAGQALGGGPRLQKEQVNDLEVLGLTMLEAIRPQTAKIHHPLDLGEDEPLVEMLIVGYVEEYGPEVWSLRYRIAQDPMRGDFYRTRILRPQYNQLYPPEKGQPKTLMEVRYPGSSEPTLAERLKSDPSLAALRSGGDPLIVEASGLVENGQSDKAKLEPTTQWLRGLLNATAGDQVQIFGVIRAERGLEWVLPPPAPKRPEEEKKRDPNAPTLKKP